MTSSMPEQSRVEWRIVVENRLGTHVTSAEDEQDAWKWFEAVEEGTALGNVKRLERRTVTVTPWEEVR